MLIAIVIVFLALGVIYLVSIGQVNTGVIVEKAVRICQTTECGKSNGVMVNGVADLVLLAVIILCAIGFAWVVYNILHETERDRQQLELDKMNARLCKAEDMRVRLTSAYYAQLVYSVQWLD